MPSAHVKERFDIPPQCTGSADSRGVVCLWPVSIHSSVKTADATPAVPPVVVADAPVLVPPPLPQASTTPQSLAECMGPDNLIDEAVANCRFGKAKRRFLDQPHKAWCLLST